MRFRSIIAALFGLRAIHADKSVSLPVADDASTAPSLQVMSTETGYTVRYRSGVEIGVTKRGWGHPRRV